MGRRVMTVALGCLMACAGDDGPTEDANADAESSAATEAPGDSSGGGDGAGTGANTSGPPATGGGDSPGDGSSGAADDAPQQCVIGQTAASEVVMIGDSYFAITEVPISLWVHARLNGSLDPQESYRTYHQGGTQLSNGQIPGQFDAALADNADIDTLIMTGGGNDVLIGTAAGCLQDPPPAQSCVDSLDVVFGAAETLMAEVAAAGVEHIVYSFYPHLPPGFPPGAKNETLDYAAPIAEQICNDAPIDCHFVDIREAFEGHPEYIGSDAIHPTPAGSQVIADLIWATMVDNCIAQ